jgi:hypothetical protein
VINPLNAELSPIFHLLALLEAQPILHVSRIRVKLHSCIVLFINFWNLSVGPLDQRVEIIGYMEGMYFFLEYSFESMSCLCLLV